MSRNRRVKCDGRKPICLKCEDDEVKCAGYPAAQSPPHAKKKLEVARRQRFELPILSEWNDAQLTQYPELASWRYQADLFNHFKTFTITDFMTGLGTFEFWYQHVLPLAHADNPVKYALCALGGVHLQFKTRHEPLSIRSSRLKLDQVVIQLYNHAIQQMTSFMSNSSQSNIEIVLVCCMIFTCIENLQGRYKEALRHLQAASALIASVQHSSGDSPSDNSTRRRGSIKPGFLDEISALIYNLGQDASYFTGHEIVPKMTCKELDDIDANYPKPPPTSLMDAEKQLRDVKMIDNAVRHYFHQNFPRPKSTTYTPTGTPPEPDEYGKRMWRTVISVLQDWIDRFDTFKEQLNEEELSKQDRQQLQNLCLSRSSWSLFINQAFLRFDDARNDAEKILEIAENLIETTTIDDRPVFLPSSDLVSIICLACERSARLDVKSKCVGLLRKMQRKEGIWDSQEMADIYEGWILTQERGLMGPGPMDVPQLAKVLSALKLPTAPSRAILSLSED